MPEQFLQGSAGTPFRTNDPAQAQAAIEFGNRPISREQAEEAAAAQRNLSYVDQNYGMAGKFAAGVGSGLTLGLGPGLLAKAGLVEPGTLSALETSPLYTIGDVAGTALPAFLTGGEGALARGAMLTPAGAMTRAGGLAERLAGGILGDSAGLFGRVASTPIRMASRGAAEGALINMGHTVGEGLIQDHPLSAESIAASGADGALFGGLLGAGLGSVGALGEAAAEGMNAFAKRSMGGSGTTGRVAKYLNLGNADKSSLMRASEVLETGGSKIGDTTSGMLRGATEAESTFAKTRAAVGEDLTKLAPDMAPSMERIRGRLNDTIVAPRGDTITEAKVAKTVNRFLDDLEPTSKWSDNGAGGFQRTVTGKVPLSDIEETPTWSKEKLESLRKNPSDKPIRLIRDSGKKWSINDGIHRTHLAREAGLADIEAIGTEYSDTVPNELAWKKIIASRDQLEAQVSQAGSKYNDVVGKLAGDKIAVKREILNALDDEIRSAMEGASDRVPGAAEKYASATQMQKTAQELKAALGDKAAKNLLSTGHGLNTHDFTSAAFSAAMGHPVGAGLIVAGKLAARRAGAMAEPWLAEMAYNQMVGTKAAGATLNVQNRVAKALGNFFKNTAKIPNKTAQTVAAERQSKPISTREEYEKYANKMEELTSDYHQQKVRKYTEDMAKQGFPQLAAELVGANARAVQYVIHNMPPRKGAKHMSSLRPVPVSKVPDLTEHSFIRKGKGVLGPLGVVDSLEGGSLSRDEIRAAAYVYPAVWGPSGLVAQQAAEKVVEMKQKGEALPMDKVYMLAVALNTPLDSTLRPEYINSVQASLNPPAQPGPGPTPPPNRTTAPQDLMTPAQKAMT